MTLVGAGDDSYCSPAGVTVKVSAAHGATQSTYPAINCDHKCGCGVDFPDEFELTVTGMANQDCAANPDCTVLNQTYILEPAILCSRLYHLPLVAPDGGAVKLDRTCWCRTPAMDKQFWFYPTVALEQISSSTVRIWAGFGIDSPDFGDTGWSTWMGHKDVAWGGAACLGTHTITPDIDNCTQCSIGGASFAVRALSLIHISRAHET